MNRYIPLIVICFLFMAAPCLASAGDTKIALGMEYKIKDGKNIKKSFGTVNVSTLNQRGLWIAFRKEKDMGFPGIVFGGNLIFCNDSIEQMDSLELVVTVINGKAKITKRSVLFSKPAPWEAKQPPMTIFITCLFSITMLTKNHCQTHWTKKLPRMTHGRPPFFEHIASL